MTKSEYKIYIKALVRRCANTIFKNHKGVYANKEIANLVILVNDKTLKNVILKNADFYHLLKSVDSELAEKMYWDEQAMDAMDSSDQYAKDEMVY